MDEQTKLALRVLALYFGKVVFDGTGTNFSKECESAMKEDVTALIELRDAEENSAE